MWGAIARMQVKADVPDAYLLGLLEGFSVDRTAEAGMLGAAFYRAEADPHELWTVVMFESEEACRTKAETRGQHAMCMTPRACLEDDMERHDVDEFCSIATKLL